MIEIKVNGQIVSVQETEPLYSGSADIQTCHFTFDKSWDGFGKSALFRVGTETHTKLVDENDCCILPWEIVTHRNAGRQIEVGMYGVSADTEIVTSVWDSLGIISEGSRPGSDARNPTDGVYEQIMSKVQNIHEEVGVHDKEMRKLVQRAETADKLAGRSATAAATSAGNAAASAKNAAESGKNAEAAKNAAATSESKAAAAKSAAAISEQNAEASKNAAEKAEAAVEKLTSRIMAAESAAAGSAAEALASAESASASAGSANAAVVEIRSSITQTTGDSETQVMSQKAVTEAIASSDLYKKILTSSDDLNSVENGSYRWVDASVPKNVPFNTAGTALQYGGASGSGCVQIISAATNKKHYFRYRSSSGWSAPTQITTETQLDEIIAQIAEISGINDGVREVLSKYNTVDAFSSTNGKSETSAGVTLTKNADQSWTLNGTATGNSFTNILSYSKQLPDTIVAGRKYYIDLHGGTAPLRVYLYNSEGNKIISVSQNKTIEIPEDTTGIIVRFQITAGMTFDNETVRYTMLSEPLFDGTGITQTVNQNTYENTYNITCSPEITVDADGWLMSVDEDTTDETGKTDMTGAIMAMLNSTGHCRLGVGIFYVSGNIDMPIHSTIEGCGDKTEIRLLSSVESGYVIRPTKYCTIKNLAIGGAPSSVGFEGDIGTRHGIYFAANADGNDGDSNDEVRYSTVSNVFIRRFSGGGITLHNTGYNYQDCLYCSDCFITYCHTGINIDYFSEFNKFVNCLMTWCYYACVNNGGNNAFSNCTFHATNTGFLIDNSAGDKVNTAHGLCVGGTFCHIGSNKGSAITVKGTPSGYVFTGCQVHYNSIDIENSYGIVFNAVEFGRGTTGAGAVINVSGGGLVMFNGCVFMNDAERPPQITITDNDLVKFVNCYGSHTGNEYPAVSA